MYMLFIGLINYIIYYVYYLILYDEKIEKFYEIDFKVFII